MTMHFVITRDAEAMKAGKLRCKEARASLMAAGKFAQRQILQRAETAIHSCNYSDIIVQVG